MKIRQLPIKTCKTQNRIKSRPEARGVQLDEDEKGVVSTDTPGGIQEILAVNESGLYNLVLGSRKPEAKQFKRWVTHEVLLAIRNTAHRRKDMQKFSDFLERAKERDEEENCERTNQS